MKTKIVVFFLFYFCLTQSCNYNEKNNNVYSDTLYVFHAGSLSYPFHIFKDSLLKRYSNIKILSQACGSKQCVRNIIDLRKKWDIFLSADVDLIDSFLVPNYSLKSYTFLSNEMVISYTNKSKYSNEINSSNWIDILSKPEVKLAFSDPASDPCGVRIIAVLKLSESFYKKPDLLKKIRYKDKNVIIRPKEVDLLTLLELGEVDFTIIYKSVALQHNLKIVTLSDSINLSNPKLQSWYESNTISYNITNNKKISEPVKYIKYGYCINKNSEKKESVKKFVELLKSDVSKNIFESCGHTIIEE